MAGAPKYSSLSEHAEEKSIVAHAKNAVYGNFDFMVVLAFTMYLDV